MIYMLACNNVVFGPTLFICAHGESTYNLIEPAKLLYAIYKF